MPSRLYEMPSYQGLDGDPAKKPPPWIQTSTGSCAVVSPGAGVNTFALSVESPGKLGSGMVVTGPNGRRWGVAPGADASSSPSHGRAGSGAANRSSPTGGCAKGIP